MVRSTTKRRSTRSRATSRTKTVTRRARKTRTTKRKLRSLSPVKTTKRTTRRMTRGRTGKIRTKKPVFTTKWQIEHQSLGIGPLLKGKLGQYGYSTKKTETERKTALAQAVRDYGATSIFRSLNAIATYNKNTNPEASKIFLHDRDMVKRNYMM